MKPITKLLLILAAIIAVAVGGFVVYKFSSGEQSSTASPALGGGVNGGSTNPTTSAPTTSAPTTSAPTTSAPTTSAPICSADEEGNGVYNNKCKFPFTYKGETYTQCATVQENGTHSYPWCDFDIPGGETGWGYCNSGCPNGIDVTTPLAATGECSSSHKTTPEFKYKCKFPFKYKGREFNSCTQWDGDDRPETDIPWCAWDSEFQDGRWGSCNPDTCV